MEFIVDGGDCILSHLCSSGRCKALYIGWYALSLMLKFAPPSRNKPAGLGLQSFTDIEVSRPGLNYKKNSRQNRMHSDDCPKIQWNRQVRASSWPMCSHLYTAFRAVYTPVLKDNDRFECGRSKPTVSTSHTLWLKFRCEGLLIGWWHLGLTRISANTTFWWVAVWAAVLTISVSCILQCL
jgi:hypothetical protein